MHISRALTIAILSTVFLQLPQIVNASIQRGFDSSLAAASFVAGDGNNLAVDDSTGLEWLDLTLTANRSVAEIGGLRAAGGILESFRYASTDEIATLFANLSFPTTPGAGRTRFEDLDNSAYRFAVDLIGEVQPTRSDPTTQGLTVLPIVINPNPNNASETAFAFIQDVNFPSGPRPAGVDTHTSITSPLSPIRISGTQRFDNAGHFLVRASSTSVVPEPGSLVVWGFLGAVVLRLRRRQLIGKFHNVRGFRLN